MIPVILNPPHGWAFEGLAQMLSSVLWIDVRSAVGDFNYLLELDDSIDRSSFNSFIPIRSIELASDKRKLERVFDRFDVKRPKTFILEDVDRDLDNENLLNEINERLAKAFWQRIGVPPWGKTWKYRDK
jgi:hypothetical protein